MVWLNPPPTVLQWRTQLLASPTLQGSPWNMVTGSFHYPTLNPTQANPLVPAPDQMPCMVLSEEEQERLRYAEGTIGLISGTLIATLYVASTQEGGADAGTLETLLRQVMIDLELQYYGFNFLRMRTKLASNPSPAMQAAGQDTLQANYTTASLIVQYGLTRTR
jgi:hypothetical protein